MITTWSEGNADDHMDGSIVVETASVVRRHPWWRARTKLILALLRQLGILPPARVLDAGCGWGVTLEALELKEYSACGLDVSLRCLTELDRPERKLILADLARPLPGGFEAFDSVLALDVIEHLDDEHAALESLGRLTKLGSGVLIVSVPARPELFSEFDDIQGHRRRYLPEQLRHAFDDTGLSVESVFWWGAWMVPILKRRIGRMTKKSGESTADVYRRYLRLPTRPMSWLLRIAYAIEQPLSLAGRLRTGTSLFAVARRLE